MYLRYKQNQTESTIHIATDILTSNVQTWMLLKCTHTLPTWC